MNEVEIAYGNLLTVGMERLGEQMRQVGAQVGAEVYYGVESGKIEFHFSGGLGNFRWSLAQFAKRFGDPITRKLFAAN